MYSNQSTSTHNISFTRLGARWGFVVDVGNVGLSFHTRLRAHEFTKPWERLSTDVHKRVRRVPAVAAVAAAAALPLRCPSAP